MGKLFYWLSIQLYVAGLAVVAPFYAKARKMRDGRKGTFEAMTAALRNNSWPVVWIHCASLGEFEQARPVIDTIKQRNAELFIVVTFFSPSGYEVRKDYQKADAVFYLPFDGRAASKRFLDIVNPILVYFVKYEFWHYYLTELKRRQIPTILFSAIFRPSQLFFKPYGYFYRNILHCFGHIFVQNPQSEILLRAHNFDRVTLAGDTRFDRVYEVSQASKELPVVRVFKGESDVFVIGSSWEDDLRMMTPFINKWIGRLKFIIAPHELTEKNFQHIERSISGNVVRYSASQADFQRADVLLIDNMGLLSSLYGFGSYAYIGGALGSGLHNVLEAAVYGIPVFFGRSAKNAKFQEAIDLLHLGAAFEVEDSEDLDRKVEEFAAQPDMKKQVGMAAAEYVRQKIGATDIIIHHTQKYFQK